MIFVVAFFCVAAPVFRSIMLDLMWILPLSMSEDSNNGGADNSIATTAQYQRKAEVNLSASSISKTFDALGFISRLVLSRHKLICPSVMK